ncbi:MAG TPA: hypothetical protein VLS49_00810, partial [Usitatibacter sp.]|nr:hypothetical protein [Usitatibacter sp.]
RSPDYGAIGHSAADTLDKADSRVLDRNVAALASLAFEIADDPQRTGNTWSAARTARVLSRDHQDAPLRGLGMWPFRREAGR